MHTRDLLKLLIYPIIVGVVLLLGQLVMERYKTTRKVSAIIEGPFAFSNIHELFDQAKISLKVEWRPKAKPSPEPEKPRDPRAPSGVLSLGIGLELDINELQIYKVTIRNTGNSPIRDLPIRLVFGERE